MIRSPRDVMADLLATGLTVEQQLLMSELAMVAASGTSAGRSSNAIRQQRYRDRRAVERNERNDERNDVTPSDTVTNRNESVTTVTNVTHPRACVGDNNPSTEVPRITSEAKASSVGAAKSNDRGSRIPADWSPTPEQLDYAVSEGLTDFSARREAGKFLDYWRNVPGAKGRKLDWNLTWKRWAQTAAERQPTNERPHHNRPSTKLEHLADIGAAMRAAVGPGGA